MHTYRPTPVIYCHFFGQTLTPNGTIEQHNHVEVTVFASSIYQLQDNILQHLNILQLGAINERDTLKNRIRSVTETSLWVRWKTLYLLDVGSELRQGSIDQLLLISGDFT